VITIACEQGFEFAKAARAAFLKCRQSHGNFFDIAGKGRTLFYRLKTIWAQTTERPCVLLPQPWATKMAISQKISLQRRTLLLGVTALDTSTLLMR
jgi:uncharacterized protein YbjT (DUF2867 family)